MSAQHSILGASNRERQIPTGGTIRGGIQVLTKAAEEHEGIRTLYERGVRAGVSYQRIEIEIRRKFPNFKGRPMYPRNVPYFVARQSDFAPGVADLIMNTYGSEGDEGFQLYTFPVVLPVDGWINVLPHKLSCYGSSGIRYWSEYDSEGNRHCMMMGEVAVDARAKRARIFGGRPIIRRPDRPNGCEPNECQEYGAGHCVLGGRLLFFIPGIPGLQPFQLPTTSYYSMTGIKEQLELLANIRGRIDGTVGGRAFLWATKRQDEVSRIDPADGKPKRVRQWMIHLEADVEMVQLYAAQEQGRLLTNDGGNAAAALAAPERDPSRPALEAPRPAAPPSGPARSVGSISRPEGGSPPSPPQEEEPPPPDAPPPDMQEEAQAAAPTAAERGLPPAVLELQTQIAEGLEILGLRQDEWEPYAVHKWGDAWSSEQATLADALAEISRGADDAHQYVSAVRGFDLPFPQ